MIGLKKQEFNEFTAPDHQQNITMMRSFDNGVTWGTPEIVSFRSGARDGMPVPIYLLNDKGIVLAIEDNGINGAFKPVIISTSVEDKWSSGTVLGTSTKRKHALRVDQQLETNIYAGAPYIIQLSNKQTLLCIQSSEERNNPNLMN